MILSTVKGAVITRHLIIFEELPSDGDVSACTESLATRPQVSQQVRSLRPPVEGGHVQGTEVVLEQLLRI